MINDFINSVAGAVKVAIGDIIVYSEDIPQDFKTPSCYIHCIDHNQQLMTRGRRKLTTIEVIYFPAENGGNTNREMHSAAELLVDNLCMVEHEGKKYKATEVTVNFGDELHYISSYGYNTLYSTGDNKMRTLKIKQEAD